ncbi:MAG TPA: ABC transporter ATP-binding protein [Phycicoccus elongatus]|uniref:ABC transporter ATP-binding protein n=1 Tax=Phycicoccus TaxID=367298 RepID=UPI001D483670|nr:MULTISPECIES: ABC transporter ATP-binding protein [Phycicoccus]MCB1240229.1 ABC transporter ATP-binding protein [Tetrasphaera sp.]MCB9407078.1 ABC transporter ATP-binding protein [Tetrasphaera sp.]MCO5303212.1 ABC transporter ATP-binding protein [Phycicoccus sp.]HPK11397.1 ABC transporter ATP-binding protein [Phycicoccus elongatus]HPQ72429.1 ABC transporter ATP-binding protein [Phycicoccus elongatus]
MSAAPIVVDHLTKSFGTSRAVDDVSLTVTEGQVFGFLGPNGAGKSTTIRCLLGLYRPTSGRAAVLGHDPAARDRSFLWDVGYLPGELRLPEQLTGADILRRFASMRGLRDTAYQRQLVARLGADLTRPLRTLSKGNKQKIGIVLALMHRPRLLVLDEPTSGLDPLLQDEFLTLLRETVEDGRTVLLSSHDLDEVQRIVQRIAVIKEGRIVLDDTIEALRASAPRTIELTFDRDTDATALAAVPGVTVRTATGRRVTLSHTGPPGPVLSVIASLQPETITARPADLDELFLRLYGTDDKDRP